MADNTKIEWTDATWNPITGCSVVSPGCTNCYAMRLAGTRMKHHPSRAGLTTPSRAGPVWNGKVRLNEDWLTQPRRWRKPRRIFVCAHGDLFHEDVPDEWIDRVFHVIQECPRHVFQILTKRAERMRDYVTVRAPGPISNVWLGVSVEDHPRAEERIPDLLATPAAVRFVSAEPLLGPVCLEGFLMGVPSGPALVDDDGSVLDEGAEYTAPLNWLIVGGESGPNARPMHPGWARSLRDQCQEAGVAFHFKQWGEWSPDTGPLPDGSDPFQRSEVARFRHDRWMFHDAFSGPREDHDGPEWVYRIGKARAGRLLDGREWNEVPE